MSDNYQLSCALPGHTADVRGVAGGLTTGGKSFIVSGSRDRTSKVWMKGEDGEFQVFQSCEGHTNFVSCVCVILPNQKHPTGLILTGGNDHTILGFELGNGHPVYRLVGHRGTVCTIDSTSDSLLVSGSWDKTAKVWAEQENIANLEGHEAAVWAVATIGGSQHKILTGSADHTIRLWTNYVTTRTYRGHTDCVRALAVVDANRFLSGSNDASIRLWNVNDGETIHIFYGHTNFIYSLALLPNTENFFSVGEDRTLRIWKGSECQQVIHLPATSVWSVACLPNGDVVTGSSDGVVRIFTCVPERKADPVLLQAFDKQVSESVIAAQQELGGMKLSELPGPENLLKPGKKDGETIMVREGASVACYAWSANEAKWNKVGDVVGASGATQNTSGRVLHDGQEYDYVFRVDLDDKSSLKLPYNITEDPWFAAQKFIDKNNLSQAYLEQVANFIVNNTKGMQVGPATPSEYTDPFTGGNRYVPGTRNADLPQVGGGGGVDPFTFSGAYTTSTVRPDLSTSSSTSNTTINANDPQFPVTNFLRFAQPPNYDALRGKLTEFIRNLGSSAIVKEENVEILLQIGTAQRWDIGVEQILKGCLTWPAENLFPVLDLLRIGVLSPKVAEGFGKSFNVCSDLVTAFVTQENSTNQMLMLKILCNLFGTLTLPLMENRTLIVSKLLTHLGKGKQNHIAAATLFLNYSVAFAGAAADPSSSSSQGWYNVEGQTEILMTAVSLADLLTEPEAIYRLLVGIGNTIHKNEVMVSLLKSLNGEAIVTTYARNAALPKIQICAQQILTRMESSTN
jgi:phospholipase A-2-activating protein